MQHGGAEAVPQRASAHVCRRATPAVHQRAAGSVPPHSQAGVPKSAATKVRLCKQLWSLAF